MKKLFTTTLLLAAVALFSAASAFAQDLQALITADDENVLIETISKPGDEPNDILVKNVACKRLAVIGTEKAIPALVAMLPNEKQNFNARFALEAMPFEASDAALAKAAKELEGVCLVGVIDSIGVRAKAESVALLKEIGDKTSDVNVKKAVFAALGAIATDEAADYLVANVNDDLAKADLLIKRGLGDAILDVAQERENAGDKAAAIKLYAAAQNAGFPSFVQEAGFYRTILCSDASIADAVVAALKGDNASKADAALKTVRELQPEVGVAVAKALVASFNDFSEAMQIRVARALGDRKDDESRKIAYDQLEKIATSDSVALKVAAAQAFPKNAMHEAAAFNLLASNLANFDSEELSAAIVAMAAAFEGTDFYFAWKGICEKDFAAIVDKSANAGLAYMKIAELRRTPEAGKALVKIAETKKDALRDGALSALSEIVTLDSLEMLVVALDGETDDAKVDWLLRAACTRLPQEDCAAKVAELFAAAKGDAKIKMIPLLKQIGGPTALMAVANACNGETLDAATQILGEWNNPDDAAQLAEVCLIIAKQSNDAKYHTRGIRGYIRVARQFELPVDTKIAMCKTAFDVAKRPEDKALIFEVFKRKIVAENVAAALEYAKYPEFKDAACEAAVFVAEKIRDSQQDWVWTAPTEDQAKAQAGKILVDGMKKVVETTSNADVKARAQKLL